jgi:hypothetical protein
MKRWRSSPVGEDEERMQRDVQTLKSGAECDCFLKNSTGAKKRGDRARLQSAAGVAGAKRCRVRQS